MKIGKIIISIISVTVALLICFLIFATVTDFKPEEKITLSENNNPDTLKIGSQFSALIWNIGYCGLDSKMDFFYDGGKKVITPYKQFKTNLKEVTKTLSNYNSIDFIMLQEVDIDSKRSYNNNQFIKFDSVFNNYASKSFAYNYKVKYVPMPLNNPLGKTNSGLAFFSKYKYSQSIRIAFPGNYSWPTSIFMLDRCFMVNRIPVENGKQLLIINTHNSAYDDGTLKQQQMDFLKEFLETEYKKGNYIIIGGDWNQTPPNTKLNNAPKRGSLTSVSPNYLTNWIWITDSTSPTNRYLDTEYNKQTSSTTIIDFFLVSPNIKPNLVKTLDYSFKYSDHNPVMVKFTLM